jgi:hypothetical protein
MDWNPFYYELRAISYELYPALPGFGGSETTSTD